MMSSLIMRSASRLLVPLSLVFAVFMYFKGHQTPGGGFVAGLVTGVALIVHRMAHGRQSLHELMFCSERVMIVIGMFLALGTGLTAWFAGLPFLTSNFGYLMLPQTSGDPYPFEWATVMAFDLGVVLVVAGVTVGMIDALTLELDVRPSEQEDAATCPAPNPGSPPGLTPELAPGSKPKNREDSSHDHA